LKGDYSGSFPQIREGILRSGKKSQGLEIAQGRSYPLDHEEDGTKAERGKDKK